MDLDTYLIRNGLTSAQFGELSGVGSKQTVHKYRHGLRFPNPENLRRIREATKGAVTADDFVDQHAGKSPSPTGKPPPPPGRSKRSDSDSVTKETSPRRRGAAGRTRTP